MVAETNLAEGRQGWVRTVAEPAVVMVCALALAVFVVGLCVLVLTGNQPGARDIVSFWAAGRQILHHANPYDSAAIQQIELAAGYSRQNVAMIMRNPPWALCLVMPLGLMANRPAALLWSLLLLGCLVVSVHILWAMHGRPKNKLHFFGYTFGPALTCVLAGQTALFALVGLVLFLRLHRERPFWAGAALWLCALKPHLFLPFGAVLLVWIVVSRSYRVLAGAGVALAASAWVAWWLDPAVWAQYGAMMRSTGIEREFIPCLGIALRLAIRPEAMWLQYVPAALGCVWAVGFYGTRRARWDWMEDGALLLVVSLLVSPYAWPTDGAILIPAVLVGVYRASSRAQLGVLALVSAFLEMATLAGRGLHSAVYLLLAPLWLGWFVWVSVGARCEAENIVLPDGRPARAAVTS